jgi:hypothetical protein
MKITQEAQVIEVMRERWEKYCREFSYAKGIQFDDVCEKIRKVLMIVF